MNRWWLTTGLAAVLLVNLWLRCHVVGPAIRASCGVDLYLATSAEPEPLDCDEAIYGTIGDRLARGAVMYRDLTENKPPGGYWLYALAVKLGGPTELTIRLLPIPFVLATTVLVGWVGCRLRGPLAGTLAALVFAVASTDPFLYGESANMEHMVNLFAFAALAFLIGSWGKPGPGGLILSGAMIGAAFLVKQTALLHAPVFAVALLLRRGAVPRSLRARLADVAELASGTLIVVGLAVLVLVAQGAGPQAFDDIVRYGGALATETPAPPHAPPFWLRTLTGNADPQGALPWPFGSTNYLVWWGTGTWPLWLAAMMPMTWWLVRPGGDAGRRLLAAWTLSSLVQVALPGLFWQHYYLLPLPGIAAMVSLFLCDEAAAARSKGSRRVLHGLVVLGLVAAVGWTVRLQVVEYLQVAPEDLVRDRGGPQWLADRALGREIRRRTLGWDRPGLFVWGWQGPLYFYSGLDGVTPQVFVDDFMKSFAGSDHPLVRPRVERMLRDLQATPPALVFTGYAPFPALRAFLETRYYPSRVAPGLWVEKSRFGAFENAAAR